MDRDGDLDAIERDFLRALSERPRPVRVIEKHGLWHQTLIDRALKLVTLGGQNGYLSDYVTTLGHTIYVPVGWAQTPVGERYKILRHEAVHVRQFERLGWVVMTLGYLFLPVPMGLAWCRARLEWEAYAETVRVTWELDGPEAARAEGFKAHIISRFSGPDYGWMWPFEKQVSGWIDAELKALSRER